MCVSKEALTKSRSLSLTVKPVSKPISKMDMDASRSLSLKLHRTRTEYLQLQSKTDGEKVYRNIGMTKKECKSPRMYVEEVLHIFLMQKMCYVQSNGDETSVSMTSESYLQVQYFQLVNLHIPFRFVWRSRNSMIRFHKSKYLADRWINSWSKQMCTNRRIYKIKT